MTNLKNRFVDDLGNKYPFRLKVLGVLLAAGLLGMITGGVLAFFVEWWGKVFYISLGLFVGLLGVIWILLKQFVNAIR